MRDLRQIGALCLTSPAHLTSAAWGGSLGTAARYLDESTTRVTSLTMRTYVHLLGCMCALHAENPAYFYSVSQAAEDNQLPPCARRKQDPKRWIAYQKRKWKAKAAQRKKRRLEAVKARDGDQPPAQRPRALSR